MPEPKTLFTQEFRDEAVRLAQTSGRSRREIASDLGIGLSTLLVWRTVFQTRAEARRALARYIDGFYNPLRRHSALGFVSPAQFERHTASQTALHCNRASPPSA
jgi:transposase InsO family protein